MQTTVASAIWNALIAQRRDGVADTLLNEAQTLAASNTFGAGVSQWTQQALAETVGEPVQNVRQQARLLVTMWPHMADDDRATVIERLQEWLAYPAADFNLAGQLAGDLVGARPDS